VKLHSVTCNYSYSKGRQLDTERITMIQLCALYRVFVIE